MAKQDTETDVISINEQSLWHTDWVKCDNTKTIHLSYPWVCFISSSLGGKKQNKTKKPGVLIKRL